MQSRAASELGITKLLPQKLSEMFLPVSLEIDLPLRIADKTNQRRTRCPPERSPPSRDEQRDSRDEQRALIIHLALLWSCAFSSGTPRMRACLRRRSRARRAVAPPRSSWAWAPSGSRQLRYEQFGRA